MRKSRGATLLKSFLKRVRNFVDESAALASEIIF